MPIIEEMPPDEPPAGLVTGVPDPDESYHDKMQKQIDREWETQLEQARGRGAGRAS